MKNNNDEKQVRTLNSLVWSKTKQIEQKQKNLYRKVGWIYEGRAALRRSSPLNDS